MLTLKDMSSLQIAFVVFAILGITYFTFFRKSKIVLYYNGPNDKRMLTKHADGISVQLQHDNHFPTVDIDHSDVINSVFHVYSDPQMTKKAGEMLGDIRLYDHPEDHKKHISNVSVVHLGNDKIFMRGSGHFDKTLQKPYITGVVTGGTGRFKGADGTFTKKSYNNTNVREMTIFV